MAIYNVDAINEQELAAERDNILDNMLEACDQMMYGLAQIDEGARTKYIDKLANRNKKLEIMKSIASSKKTIDRINDEIDRNNEKAREVGIIEPRGEYGKNYYSAEETSGLIHNSPNSDSDYYSKKGKRQYMEKYGGPGGKDIIGDKKPGMVLDAQNKKRAIKETCLTILSVLDEI